MGPVLYVGVYPLALLTAIYGPVRQVSAVGARLLSTRHSGTQQLDLQRNDFTATSLHLADGTLAHLACSFYVDGAQSGREGIEFHGDDGSLFLSSCWATNASISTVTLDGERRQLMNTA